MLERDPRTLARLQAVVTALIEHRLSSSLADVEKALTRWRGGGTNALAAHGATLRHAARCERTVERVTAAAGDRPEGILRDAVDVGLMDEDEFIELVGKPSAEIPSIGALTDDDASGPDKKRTLEQLLERGPVLVHVDARRPEVSIPTRFRSDACLILRFGYSLNPPISDLTVDDEGVGGTLTFNGTPFRCVLPWTAVFAATVEGEQRGTVWPEDVPEEMLSNSEAPSIAEASSSAATNTPIGPAPISPVTSREEPRAKRASHLKLVE